MDRLIVGLPGPQLILLCFNNVVVVVAGGSDYTDIGVTIVSLSASQSQVTIPFALIDDDVLEITEQLSASLSFGATEFVRVSISPGSTEITILDDDSKTM